MASVFGKRAKEYVENSEIERFFDMERDWTAIMAPGSVPPYDIFPFLKIVPDFLTPWRGWKQKTRSVRQRQRSLYQDLITGVKDRMAQGRSQECFLADVLHNNEKHGYSEIDLEYLGGVLLEGGADTTAGAFETFLMAMAAYPSILKMAQEEVDGIFGNDKIPTGVTDAELPFLSACFLEVSLVHLVATLFV
jgi:cytochrome P450